MSRPTLRLVGQRYGRLLVLSQAPTLRYSRWRCRCDCGTEVVVSAQLLRMPAHSGTRSCGCLRREQRAAALRRMHAARRTLDVGPRFDATALVEAMR